MRLLKSNTNKPYLGRAGDLGTRQKNRLFYHFALEFKETADYEQILPKVVSLLRP